MTSNVIRVNPVKQEYLVIIETDFIEKSFKENNLCSVEVKIVKNLKVCQF